MMYIASILENEWYLLVPIYIYADLCIYVCVYVHVERSCSLFWNRFYTQLCPSCVSE